MASCTARRAARSSAGRSAVRRRYSATRARLACAARSSRKAGTQLAITTPPRRAISRTSESGRLRGWSQSARAELWLATTGPRTASRTLQHGVVADVGDVDQDAAALHLANDPHAVVRQAAVARLVGGRIAPLVALVVGQRDVANPQGGAAGERRGQQQRAAVLEADQHPHRTLHRRPADRLRRRHQLQLAGAQLALDAVVERQGVLPTRRRLQRARDEEGEDQRRDAAVAQARQVHVAVRQSLAEVGGMVEQAAGNVGVAIDHDGVAEQLGGDHDAASIPRSRGAPPPRKGEERRNFSSARTLKRDAAHPPPDLAQRSRSGAGRPAGL